MTISAAAQNAHAEIQKGALTEHRIIEIVQRAIDTETAPLREENDSLCKEINALQVEAVKRQRRVNAALGMEAAQDG